MKVETKAYGLIDVNERQRLNFPQGLFGFEQFKDYVLLDAEQKPFYWLQSVDAKELAFVLLNPFHFRIDYEVDVDNDELKKVGISDPDQALIFSIITIPSDGSPMTANLQGPLVINRDNRCGKQIVLTDTRWKVKHDVMAELKVVRKVPC